MRKTLFIITLVILVIGGIAFLYLKLLFFPVQLKQIIVNHAQIFLSRNISIDKISYSLLKGATLHNVTIYKKEDYCDKECLAGPIEQSAVLHIEEAQFSILITPIIKDKKIIIPSLVIKNPYIHITRIDDETWNFSDLLEKESQKTEKKKGPSIFLGNVSIEDARINLTDQTLATVLFTETSLKAKLTLKKKITYELHSKIPQESSQIDVKGDYALKEKALSSEILLQNLTLAKYLNLFYKNRNLTLNNIFVETANLNLTYQADTLTIKGALTSQADLLIKNDTIAKGHITATDLIFSKQKENFDLTSSLIIKDSNIMFGGDKTIKGEIAARNIHVSWTNQSADDLSTQPTTLAADLDLAQDSDPQASSGKPVEFHLTGDIDLHKADIQLGEDKKIKGDLLGKNLALTLIDNNFSITGDLTLQNSALRFGQNNRLSGEISLANTVFNKKDSDFDVTGQLNIEDADLTTQFVQLKGLLKTGPTTLSFLDNILSLETSFLLDSADIKINEDKHLTGNITAKNSTLTIQDKKIAVNGHFNTENLNFIFFPPNVAKKEFKGNPQIDLELLYNPKDKKPFKYTGSLILSAATLEGLPAIPEIKEIYGEIGFQEDSAATEALNFNALNTTIRLAGNLANFKDPAVDIQASTSKIDLATVYPFFAQYLEPANLVPTGEAAVNINYKGLIAAPKDAQIEITAELTDASLASPRLPEEIKTISGLIKYSKNNVTWKNLQASFKNDFYTLNGSLTNFSRPIVETQITSKDINASTKIKILRKAFSIASLQGTYLDSLFDIKGDVHFLEDGTADLDIKGQLDIELNNLSEMGLPFTEKIKKLDLAGILSMEILFRGTVNNWQNGIIVITATGTNTSLLDYSFDDISIKLEQGDLESTELNINANIYGGKLTLFSSADPKETDIPFQLSAKLTDINLTKLKNNTKWKDKDFAGILNGNINIAGQAKDTNTIRGIGSMAIKDGKIGKLNLLKGIWSLLIIPEFENIIFTETYASFEVKNKLVLTDDLVLRSRPVNLFGKGWVDFDQNINLDINAQFKESEIMQSESLKKSLTTILKQAENYIGVKISGTLSEPKFRENFLPLKMIGEATSVLIEGVQTIFEEIFE